MTQSLHALVIKLVAHDAGILPGAVHFAIHEVLSTCVSYSGESQRYK